MSAAVAHPPSLRGVLDHLGVLRRATAFSRRPAPAAGRADAADLSRRSLRTVDELGLLSGEGCVTDRGLLERAERLRSGWA